MDDNARGIEEEAVASLETPSAGRAARVTCPSFLPVWWLQAHACGFRFLGGRHFQTLYWRLPCPRRRSRLQKEARVTTRRRQTRRRVCNLPKLGGVTLSDKPLRIVIADDEPIIRLDLKKMLEDCGY